MDFYELDKGLESAIDSFKMAANNQVESFNTLSEEEQAHYLPQALDEMNKRNFYMFVEFKDSIIQHLREEQRKGR